MPFLLAEILNFQGSIQHIGVGSFSKVVSMGKVLSKDDVIKALKKVRG